jgi:hypothetical protein
VSSPRASHGHYGKPGTHRRRGHLRCPRWSARRGPDPYQCAGAAVRGM